MEENQAVFAPDGRETDFTDVIPVVNKRNYGMKYYWVSLDHIKNHYIYLGINSITGEVFKYSDCRYNENSRSADMDTEKELTKQERKKGAAAARSFICEKLHMGRVVDCYSFGEGCIGVNNHTVIDTIDVSCRTESGDVVRISMDREKAIVISFEINPLTE